MTIDKHSPVPLYYQLKQMMLEKLQKKLWRPGEQLPTEDNLQREFDISRTTVRQALRELEVEGWITRQAGKGTFVAETKVREGTEPFNVSASFFESYGIEMAWQVLSAGEETAPSQIAEKLGMSAGEKTFCMRRLRIANHEPIGISVVYLASPWVDQVDLSLAETGGTMNYLKGGDMAQCMAERIVEALPASHEEARILGIKYQDPVLVITRLLRDCDGRPMEHLRAVYRGDRYQYNIQNVPLQK
jgi:GntR family transcriptional regulator